MHWIFEMILRAVQCCLVKCSTVLFTAMQYRVVKDNAMQFSTAQCSEMNSNTLKCSTEISTAMQYIVVKGYTIQFSTVQYKVMDSNKVLFYAFLGVKVQGSEVQKLFFSFNSVFTGIQRVFY